MSFYLIERHLFTQSGRRIIRKFFDLNWAISLVVQLGFKASNFLLKLVDYIGVLRYMVLNI